MRDMATAGLPIGELAKRTGLSPDSLRHYERLGLLAPAPRSVGGARRFPAAAERQVRIIQAALRIGFTLAELSQVLTERRRGGAPCRKVYAMARAKLDALERRLCELQQLRDALNIALRNWEARLGKTAPGLPAGLLDALADEVSSLAHSPLPRRRKAFL
jgi:MerR family transcriptional regulator, copper efflux regulator